MISKLEYQKLPAGHEDKWGGYNDFPPGWTKISTKELVQSTLFSTHRPKYIEYRQMLTPGKPVVGAFLYFYHNGTGIGVVCDYWNAKVAYFRFGCKHEYHEIGSKECKEKGIYHGGSCYHVYECSKCGNIDAVDSSD